MTTWAVMLGVGAGSYALRVLPIVGGAARRESRRAEELLACAGTAALVALVAAGFGHSAAPAEQVVGNLAAIGVGLAVALRGGSMLRVLAAGLACWAALQLAAAVL